jgi:hypothetical protein
MSEKQTFERKTVPPSQVSGTTLLNEVALAELVRAAGDPELTEDLALALLKRSDLPAEALERLAKNVNVVSSRKVKIAVASHPHTPRHVSVPLSRQFYTFDLMKVALSPSVPADVKVAIDTVLISRLSAVTAGERLTLARRASGRVAAMLLTDITGRNGKTAIHEVAGGKMKNSETVARETRVMRVALDNPRLTESLVIKAILRLDASEALISVVAQHEKWSLREEIRAALLRTEYLSLARALEFIQGIPMAALQEVLGSSRLPLKFKEHLLRERTVKS